MVKRGVVYSQIVFIQILSGDSLCGKSCVDELVGILLCEGGDVELRAQTSKYISVFAFDPLSLTLSYIVHYIILPYHIHACVVCMCPYLCITKRALHSTSTLI